jgi:hypothetical protein
MLPRTRFEVWRLEIQVQAALSHPGTPRWLVPVLLGIVVPLLLAALPGESWQIVARDADLVKHVRAEVALLHEVQTRFAQAEQDGVSGRSPQARQHAISDVQRAIAMIANENPAIANVEALRDAIATYAQAITQDLTVEGYVDPETQARLVSAQAHAVGSILGQLQSGDEARLREPLQAMRVAETTELYDRDPHAADQFSRLAGIFTARVDGMAIPQGTRASLTARLVAYEHAVLSLPNALARQHVEAAAASARAVEAALDNVDRALTAEQRRLNRTFEAACKGFVWSIIAALGASLLIVGTGVFGRAAFDHGLVRIRHAR